MTAAAHQGSRVSSTGVARSWAHRVLVSWISAYQRAREGRPSPCRFTPSCSTYALEALEVHGTGRGLWLAVRRMGRCRPFGPSGFDPVPDLSHVRSHSRPRGQGCSDSRVS